MKHTFYVFQDKESGLFVKKYTYSSSWISYDAPKDERDKFFRNKLYKKTFTDRLGQARVFYSAAVAKSSVGIKEINRMFNTNVEMIEVTVEI